MSCPQPLILKVSGPLPWSHDMHVHLGMDTEHGCRTSPPHRCSQPQTRQPHPPAMQALHSPFSRLRRAAWSQMWGHHRASLPARRMPLEQCGGGSSSSSRQLCGAPAAAPRPPESGNPACTVSSRLPSGSTPLFPSRRVLQARTQPRAALHPMHQVSTHVAHGLHRQVCILALVRNARVGASW